MPNHPKKYFPFWQELKRRKVLKIIPIYAATAFVIMEAADIMLPRLGLPDWTVTFIIVLLIVGFPIAIILAWIYDLTPEGIRKTDSLIESEEQDVALKAHRRKMKPGDVIIAVLFVTVCVLIYPKIFQKDRFENLRNEDGRISIAVMPYENLTGDSALDYLQRGISSLIINGLGGSEELSVRDDHAMHEVIANMDQINTAGFSPSLGKEAAILAKTETYISGSFQGAGDHYVILTNLIETESGDLIWSHKMEGDLTSSEYLDLGSSLCSDIRDHLELKALKEGVDYDFREAYTKSSLAYRHYIEGMNHIMSQDYNLAIESLTRAMEIDSTFTFAAFYIAWSYCYSETFTEVEYWTAKAHEMRESLPVDFRYLVELWYADFNLKDGEELSRYCELLAKSDSRSRLFWFDIGVTYGSMLKDYENSIKAFENVEEINRERGQDWDYFQFYQWYIRSLHEAGNYEKEQEISDLGLKLYPDNLWLFRRRFSLALLRADSAEIEEYSGKLERLKMEHGWSEANYESRLALIYYRANQIAEAEIHARKAVVLEPQDISQKMGLSWILIFDDLNPEEGLNHILEMLEELPDNGLYLGMAGVAYRKLGKLGEAQDFLGRAIDMSSGYMHEYQLELDEVNRVLAANQQ